ncbi:hypothetical protein [Neobacillus rhizophilus]|uniref:Uncharacterized protein n=1 Tax=Neobacillus rhizophilus TaxID=2833579 RepID=A0A942U7Z3_9BACI|nr:hypothetical protein [Neobacillus rhizophilus]MBS4215150.1 hypothetical protein [Neobacillus rhizophilus]
MQTIVSRHVNPIDTAVVSCTEMHTDGIRNAIPTNVEIKGDTRSFTPEVQKLLENKMRKLCEGICDMYGALVTSEMVDMASNPKNDKTASVVMEKILSYDHSVLQFKAGLLMDQKLANEVLEILDYSMAEAANMYDKTGKR